MSKIKKRRLTKLTLNSHPDLYVGGCVPFYFGPRSIMLFKIFKANDPDLGYHGGQEPVVHLEADLRETVSWANHNDRRWAFTTSNAGSFNFEDFSDLKQLSRIDWEAVRAHYWVECQYQKQAELLIEHSFPWHLVTRIGILSRKIYPTVQNALSGGRHRPSVEIKPNWYY